MWQKGGTNKKPRRYNKNKKQGDGKPNEESGQPTAERSYSNAAPPRQTDKRKIIGNRRRKSLKLKIIVEKRRETVPTLK